MLKYTVYNTYPEWTYLEYLQFVMQFVQPVI